MAGFAALATVAPVGAATVESCDQPARFTANQIAGCLNGVQAASDERLNHRYNAALASLPPADRVVLRDAQRAWLAFRAKDRASLAGNWRAARNVRVRIDAARADLLAIDARERQLRVYLPGAR